jgi:hypothetical protein
MRRWTLAGYGCMVRLIVSRLRLVWKSGSYFVPNPKRSERLVGRGTRMGELWLRGTADREVMGVCLGRLVSRALSQNASATVIIA